MTAKMIYRLFCDAPDCDASVIAEKSKDTPDGWSIVRSDAHLDGWEPPVIKLSNGRTRRDKRDLWDVTAGSFALHLCPKHPDSFAEHLPSTTGSAMSRLDRMRVVTVKCSCGHKIPWVNDVHMVSPKNGAPGRTPEAAWWRHLPTELQAYANRGSAL